MSPESLLDTEVRKHVSTRSAKTLNCLRERSRPGSEEYNPLHESIFLPEAVVSWKWRVGWGGVDALCGSKSANWRGGAQLAAAACPSPSTRPRVGCGERHLWPPGSCFLTAIA